MSDLNDMHRLFADYSCGEISTEQLQTLEAALRDDAELRREFIEYMNVDSALGDLAALPQDEMAEIEALEREGISVTQINGESVLSPWSFVEFVRTYRVVAMTGAVAAMLLLTTILWFADPAANTEMPVATLVSKVDADLMYDGKSFSGAELPIGQYELEQGLLHLQFGHGVMVYVEAPARFDAVSDKRVVLHSGRLSASVPPEGIGFAVDTPEAEVVDFGTEFSVDVENGSSEVHVFDGLVRVHPRSHTNGDSAASVDLKTSQAIRIGDSTPMPVDIAIAPDRFIRSFDEPKPNYTHSLKLLSPVAYYRMAIRDQGLVSNPPQYSGVILTGEGKRPTHARGVFRGGSLQVKADSSGRGGRVDSPPPLRTGHFSLAVFVYLDTSPINGTVATNIHHADGNFTLSTDDTGAMKAVIRNAEGEFMTVSGDSSVPTKTWQHVVITVDGKMLRLYENGQLVASTQSRAMANSESQPVWFGTNADAERLWDGRIDELALFDKALSSSDIAHIYEAAKEKKGWGE